MKDLDLEIVDYFEGDKKITGMLGGFIVRYKDGNLVRVGSGFEENLRKEIWKDLKGYEGMYLISNFGNVKGIGKRGRCSFKKKHLVRGNIFIRLNDGKKCHMVK